MNVAGILIVISEILTFPGILFFGWVYNRSEPGSAKEFFSKLLMILNTGWGVFVSFAMGAATISTFGGKITYLFPTPFFLVLGSIIVGIIALIVYLSIQIWLYNLVVNEAR